MSTNKTCRICLVQQPPVHFSVSENNITLMLEALTFKKVNPDTITSNIICLKCFLNLKLTYKFQQKVKNCEEKLEKMRVKQEPLVLQLESVVISDDGEVKSDQEACGDVVKLCDICPICGLHTSDDSLNDHIRGHFLKIRKCESCDLTFSNIQQYKEHLLQHSDTSLYQCDSCKATFFYKTLYDLHLDSNSCNIEPPDDATEQIIKLGLRSQGAMQVLLKPNKINPNKNSTVGKIVKLGLLTKSAMQVLSKPHKIKSKKSLVLHKIADESAKRKIATLGLRSAESIKLLLGAEKDGEYNCDICFKAYRNKRTLQAHTHVMKKCEICGREVTKYTYKRHMEDHELGPQICHLCGATLQSRSSLTAHVFYSHNSQRHKCEECGKLFKKRNAKDQHVRKEHKEKPSHYCETCGKGFYNKHFLEKHINMKHLKLRPHICEFCAKGFSSMYALKTHRRQHTKETPYKCEVCGEGFRQNVSLKSHKKTKHDITEPVTCECKICGKGFPSTVSLYGHMRLH